MLRSPPSARFESLLESGDRILFEGDSLTEGLGNPYARLMAWDKTWAHLVDEWWFAHRPDLVLESRNLAVCGSTTRAMLARSDAAAAFRPGIAFFTLGTNDALVDVPLEEFGQHLHSWCERLQSAGCRAVIAVGGFVPCPNADEETLRNLARCAPYWRALREVMSGHGRGYLDVGPHLQQRAETLGRRWPQHTVYSGGLHYNALGNSLIAGAVLEALGFWRPAQEPTSPTPRSGTEARS